MRSRGEWATGRWRHERQEASVSSAWKGSRSARSVWVCLEGIRKTVRKQILTVARLRAKLDLVAILDRRPGRVEGEWQTARHDPSEALPSVRLPLHSGENQSDAERTLG